MPEATIDVRLQPKGGRNEIVGVRDGVLVIRVAAAPVDGKANTALCKLIAKRAGVPRDSVSIVRGERARDKAVRVLGVDEDRLRRLLSPPPGG